MSGITFSSSCPVPSSSVLYGKLKGKKKSSRRGLNMTLLEEEDWY